ncbi:probable receptor-like protein kinase At5g20050 [Camellia sinensis]|uniref:probable receptor-like protein kinase At5g20050 n=1 Tax=Camellia sinensis TaxID=4442 RepID=UPI0010369A69|nr:probable receptor-like protein kinase At5g20050 [Camellia sinensis]
MNNCVVTEDFKERLGGGAFGFVFKGMLEDDNQIVAKRFSGITLPCLNCQAWKKIILHIAKGLAYLHEECRQRIIHLNIKPQNILLDEDFNVKISDFELYKLINREESHVLTTMRGTPGYIGPEWWQARVTIKTDIYSFRIVLLEIVSRWRNIDSTQLESRKHLLQVLREKAEYQLIDIVENMDEGVKQYHAKEVVRMTKIGAWCLQNDQSKRPFMSIVVKVLQGWMEVETNINYNFTYAMASSSTINNHASMAPPALVLSNPQ